MHAATSDAVPRLMGVQALADYLSLSYESARQLVIQGHLPAVRPPSLSTRGAAMKRLLVDRSDVDRWIEAMKERRQ